MRDIFNNNYEYALGQVIVVEEGIMHHCYTGLKYRLMRIVKMRYGYYVGEPLCYTAERRSKYPFAFADNEVERLAEPDEIEAYDIELTGKKDVEHRSEDAN
jgi:hypothetical protein